MYKIQANKLPHLFCDKFAKLSTTYTYSTRGA